MLGRKISNAEQKELMLGILDCIIAYCRENSLVYYLIGGSLIGAVRHRGFIPWDDDIDIALPRKDYDFLVQHFNGFSEQYELVDISNQPKYYLPYAKIIDNRTVLFENVYGICPVGVNIDVFPLDYITDNTKNNIGKVYKKSFLEKLVVLKSIQIMPSHPVWKRMLIRILRIICPLPYTYYTRKRIQRAEKAIAKEKTDWMANLCGAWEEREITASKNFLCPVDGVFENRHVNLPNGYDEYLTGVYGDYMKLPPEEKRIAHHDYMTFWKEA